MANNQIANRLDNAPMVLKDDIKTMMAQAGAEPSIMLPQNMAEVMEFSRIMSMTTAVPPHLRGKQGDCMAVVMQAMRWGLDPFAVASKSYFVNDRLAYEAQLINAVVYARAPLEGRLQITYSDGPRGEPSCKVTGIIKGDPEPKVVYQDMSSITTRNSPLWKQSPKQQLAYYTTRLWARLYTPDVLLGVYSPDEIYGGAEMARGPERARDITPARPQRGQYISAGETTTADAETGEVTDEADAPHEPTEEERFEENVIAAGTAAAMRGTDAYREFWAGAGREVRAVLKARESDFIAMCRDADRILAQGGTLAVDDGEDGLSDEDPFTRGASANEPTAEPRVQTSGDPSPDTGRGAEGTQADLLGGDALTDSVERFIALMDGLNNAGAIESEVAKQQPWIDMLDGDDRISVDNAVSKARERARRRQK